MHSLAFAFNGLTKGLVSNLFDRLQELKKQCVAFIQEKGVEKVSLEDHVETKYSVQTLLLCSRFLVLFPIFLNLFLFPT